MANKSKRGRAEESSRKSATTETSIFRAWWIVCLVGVLCSCLFSMATLASSSGLFSNISSTIQTSSPRSLNSNASEPGSRSNIKKFAFTSTRSVEVRTRSEQWNFVESIAYMPDKFGETPLFRISSLVDADDINLLQGGYKALEYDKGLDTVDRLPSFEATLFRHGKLIVDESQMPRLKHIIEHRVLPYVRDRFNCSSCVACTSIVRRYVRGERRDHPWHYDNDAFVTVVVPLSGSSEYQGGIYVQPTFDRKDRLFIDLESGDAVVHNFDLLHGVEVLSGDRVSLIIWVKSDAHACETKSCPWYAEKAQQGHANAQYNHGRVVANGLGGLPEDRVEGVKWYVKSANQGHVMAMYNLAVCLHHGRGLNKNETAAVAWYRQAAEAGHPLAMTNYGYMTLFGKGVQQKNASEAAVWFQKAAFQEVAIAMFQLAHLLGKGDGVAKNLTAAEHWLELAVSRGHRDAKTALSSLQSTGSL